jgi:hypothetical protein
MFALCVLCAHAGFHFSTLADQLGASSPADAAPTARPVDNPYPTRRFSRSEELLT